MVLCLKMHPFLELILVLNIDLYHHAVSNTDIDKEFNLDSKNKIDWLTFTDNEKSVVEDVLRLKKHPLVPNSIPIYGYIYDCKTGNLKEVFEATNLGI